MKVLLSPPAFFDIYYQINPWMDVNRRVDRKKVFNEYEALKSTYLKLGVEVLEIKPNEKLPDMVYTANFGFLTDHTFIKANFKYSQRKEESKIAQDYIVGKFGLKVFSLPEGINFEGQGDLLRAGDKYFMGWGKRSDLEAKEYLEEALGKNVTALKLVDPYYYHLDTCFAPVSENIVVINPGAFTSEGLEQIKKSFEKVIEVSVEDNKKIACNLVVVGKNIVIGKGISETLKNTFKELGYETYEVEMDEYIKGGGSVRCLTLEL